MAVKRKKDFQPEHQRHDTQFFPTFYQVGGEWGFTCPWCHKYAFGFSSKGYAEDGMLDHYDDCDTFRAEGPKTDSVRLRFEVQDYGVACHTPIDRRVRSVFGVMR